MTMLVVGKKESKFDSSQCSKYNWDKLEELIEAQNINLLDTENKKEKATKYFPDTPNRIYNLEVMDNLIQDIQKEDTADRFKDNLVFKRKSSLPSNELYSLHVAAGKKGGETAARI